MLAENWDDYDLEFAALGFMDSDGVGQIEFNDILFLVSHLPAFREKVDHAGEILVVNREDLTDIAVENPQIVIIAPMDDPVALSEDSLSHLKLMPALPGRVDRHLDHGIDIGRPQGSAHHGTEDLDFAALALVFGDPLLVEAYDRIDSRKAIVQARPRVDLFQDRLQLCHRAGGPLDLSQIHVSVFCRYDKILFIRRGDRLGRPEFKGIAAGRKAFQLGNLPVEGPFHPGHEIDLFPRGLIGIDKETVGPVPPDLGPFERGGNCRNLATIDLMGIVDDERLLGLPEHLGQSECYIET